MINKLIVFYFLRVTENFTFTSSPVFIAPNIKLGGSTLYSDIFILTEPTVCMLMSEGFTVATPAIHTSFDTPEMVSLPFALITWLFGPLERTLAKLLAKLISGYFSVFNAL